MVRAKFKCRLVETVGAGENESQQVYLDVVTSDSPENKEWSKYTPSGSVHLGITNKDSFGKFTTGKEYFADFEEVKEDEKNVDVVDAKPEKTQEQDAASV